MKKVITLVILAMLFLGCADKQPEPSKDEIATNNTEQVNEDTSKKIGSSVFDFIMSTVPILLSN